MEQKRLQHSPPTFLHTSSSPPLPSSSSERTSGSRRMRTDGGRQWTHLSICYLRQLSRCGWAGPGPINFSKVYLETCAGAIPTGSCQMHQKPPAHCSSSGLQCLQMSVWISLILLSPEFGSVGKLIPRLSEEETPLRQPIWRMLEKPAGVLALSKGLPRCFAVIVLHVISQIVLQ